MALALGQGGAGSRRVAGLQLLATALQVGIRQFALVLAKAHVVAGGPLTQGFQLGFRGLQVALGYLRGDLVELLHQLVHRPVFGMGFAQQQAEAERGDIAIRSFVHHVTHGFRLVLI